MQSLRILELTSLSCDIAQPGDFPTLLDLRGPNTVLITVKRRPCAIDAGVVNSILQYVKTRAMISVNERILLLIPDMLLTC
jgi:hypothetical protein